VNVSRGWNYCRFELQIELVLELELLDKRQPLRGRVNQQDRKNWNSESPGAELGVRILKVVLLK